MARAVLATKADQNLEAQREAFYRKISGHHLAPLWIAARGIIRNEPVSRCKPALWNYEMMKGLIFEAGDLITAEEAERRVLTLENPSLPGQTRVTNSLFAGLQLILPGEIAPAHQHTPSAIRFVLEGEGAYTAVNGEKANMSPGDFILTPNWVPHDHGNPSKAPMLWLDVLDMPTIVHFETIFMHHFDDTMQPAPRSDGDSLARYGSGVLPDGAPVTKISPIINYTYARTRPIIERMKKSGDIDKRHGARVRYVNPTTGGWALPTLGAHLALLPKGFAGEPYRSTDGTIFVCKEGRGSTKVGDETFEWGPNDVFVVPPWIRYSHRAAEESVLFSISDRPMQEAMDIWRESN